MDIKRVDSRDIPYIQKEAVTDGLVGALADFCAGLSDEQATIIGYSPMERLASGMLVPQPSLQNEYADEIESTIHISAIGLETIVTDSSKVPVRIKPTGCIFIRILPTSEDLMNDKFATIFRPNAEVNRLISSAKNSIYQETGNDYSEKQKRFNLEARRILLGALSLSDESQLSNSVNEDDAGGKLISGFCIAKPGISLEANSAALEVKEVVLKYRRLQVLFSEQTVDLDPTSDNNQEIAKVLEIWQSEIDLTIRKWVNDKDPEKGGIHWAYSLGQSFTFDQIKHWDETLKGIASYRLQQNTIDIASLDCPSNLRVGMEVTFSKDFQAESEYQLHIEISNNTEIDRLGEVQQPNNILFGVGFSIQLPKLRHKSLHMERVKPSFRFKDYLTFDVQGFNVGVDTHISGDMLHAATTWLPRYYQPRITARMHGGIPLTFSQLKTLGGIEELTILPKIYRDWIEKIKEGDPLSGSDNPNNTIKNFEQRQFEDSCSQWSNEADRIERGITLLLESSKADIDSEAHLPYLAWKALNETMEVANKGKFDSWRTFQLAFILTVLPIMASRVTCYRSRYDPELDKAVQLLYFSTGGGKSEAFYGVLVYQLFIDRLRGKSRGVTAMISYPLRLLTTQQAQRFARILAQADKIRFDNNIGGEAFSIGFWVGGANTPNSNRDPNVSEKLTCFGQDKASTEDAISYQQEINKLPECPYCKSKTIIRRIPLWEDQIGIFCLENTCHWNMRKMDGEPNPLPFYITDDDIHARAPSILVGTVDKLSQIAFNPLSTQRVLGMFGGALARNKVTGRLISPRLIKQKSDLSNPDWVKLYPADENGEKWFYDPFPAFRVADEVHLLEESLGTFTGIYETLFRRILEELSPALEDILSKDSLGNIRFPEYIAATATVADPAHQIKNLYMRNCIQFPSPGNTLYESFYAGPDKDEQTNERLKLNDPELYSSRARIYASMLTNGKAHTTASVDVLASFHLLISKSIYKLQDGSISSLKQQLITGLAENSVKPFYEKAIQLIDANTLGTLIDLHRIALTYVTNKKGGDQIITAERDRDELWHQEAGFDVSIEPQLISGDLTLGQIEAVVAESEANRQPDSVIDIGSGIRSVVATSAISHGVDVEQYNSMFFAGMPSDTSEFIQASSRIGRTHPGFSLLLPTPQRRRDRYIVEVNQPYYRFLERMILPPSIDRWADNAMLRTTSSVFMAFLGVTTQVQQLTSSGDAFNAPRYSSQFIAPYYHNNVKLDKMINYIFDAYGLNCMEYGLSKDSTDHCKSMLKEFLITDIIKGFVEASSSEEIFNYLEGLDNRGGSRQKLYKPMTSLRDISETGFIRMATEKYVSSDDFSSMMDFISH
jgi:hypothetical protein